MYINYILTLTATVGLDRVGLTSPVGLLSTPLVIRDLGAGTGGVSISILSSSRLLNGPLWIYKFKNHLFTNI